MRTLVAVLLTMLLVTGCGAKQETAAPAKVSEEQLAKISALETDLESTRRELATAKSELTQSQQTAGVRVAALERQLTQAQQTADERIAMLEEELTEAQQVAEAEIADLSSRLTQAQQQVTSLQSQLTQAQQQVTSLRSQITQANKREADLQSELTKAENESAKWRDDWAALRGRAAQLGQAWLGIEWRLLTARPIVFARSGPAVAAGIIVGSTVTHINDILVMTIQEVNNQVARYIPTDQIRVTFEYGGQSRTVPLNLGVKPN